MAECETQFVFYKQGNVMVNKKCQGLTGQKIKHLEWADSFRSPLILLRSKSGYATQDVVLFIHI